MIRHPLSIKKNLKKKQKGKKGGSQEGIEK